VASDRDRQAAQLRHGGLSYEQITEWLGFTDRRAAHRGVARGLAEPAVDDAMIRGLAVRNMDARLQHVQRQTFAWLEQAEPRVLDQRSAARTNGLEAGEILIQPGAGGAVGGLSCRVFVFMVAEDQSGGPRVGLPVIPSPRGWRHEAVRLQRGDCTITMGGSHDPRRSRVLLGPNPLTQRLWSAPGSRNRETRAHLRAQ
jgi:hypothetical protein